MMRYLLLLTFICITFTAARSQDASPKLISMPEYMIPVEATQAGIDGKLAVLVWVKKDGTVDRAEALAGPSWPCGSNPKTELGAVRSGAEDSVKKARFSPALKDGKPEDREILLTMLVGEEYQIAKKRAAEKTAEKQSPTAPSLVRGGVINGKAISLPKPAYPFDLMNGTRARGTLKSNC